MAGIVEQTARGLGNPALLQDSKQLSCSMIYTILLVFISNSSCVDATFNESDFDDEAYYAALGTRPSVNMEELDESYQKVIELFSVCTNEDPKDRPSAAHIVDALELDVQ